MIYTFRYCQGGTELCGFFCGFRKAWKARTFHANNEKRSDSSMKNPFSPAGNVANSKIILCLDIFGEIINEGLSL